MGFASGVRGATTPSSCGVSRPLPPRLRLRRPTRPLPPLRAWARPAFVLRAWARKARKAGHALASPRGRRGLRLGAAAALEHRGALARVADDIGGAERLATVLDVGANVGQFALLAREIFGGARIHAFEPLPEMADRFEALFKDDPRTVLHRCALGAERAELEMHITRAPDSSSLLAPALQEEIFPHAGASGRVEKAPVRPLAELGIAIEEPALLKLDVQGYELEVLKGCGAALEKFGHVHAELSFVELYAGQPLAHEVIAFLAARGLFVAAVHVSDGAFDSRGRAVQADFLFSRAGAQGAS